MIRRSYYSAQLPSIRVKVYSYGKLWVNLVWLLSSYDGRCICFTDSWICVLGNFFTVMLSHLLKSVGGAKQVGSFSCVQSYLSAGIRTQFVRIWSYKLISQNQIYLLVWVIVQKKWGTLSTDGSFQVHFHQPFISFRELEIIGYPRKSFLTRHFPLSFEAL